MRSVCRIAIVEDEAKSVEKLKRYLKRFSEEKGIQFKCNVFADGVDFISDYSADYDVVLMDIEMPHMNGLEAAKRLRALDAEVCLIFVTNLASYAIEGYAVNALDFLVKPVEYQNFAMKLQKAVNIRSRVQKKEVVLSTGSGKHRFRLEDIYYIEVIDHDLKYHTTDGEYGERCPIATREEQFSPYDFARVSKSFLVNLRYVDAIQGNDVIVNGDRLPIGRTKKKEFLQKLTEYLGDCI